ncbi:hypothetical protein PENTCL1PPCAC_20695, partial [Pristionchus entomophagus]
LDELFLRREGLLGQHFAHSSGVLAVGIISKHILDSGDNDFRFVEVELVDDLNESIVLHHSSVSHLVTEDRNEN